MSELQIDAYAKINLTLEVVRRLPDGYHELRTVFQQIELCDQLMLVDDSSIAVQLTCDHATLDAGPQNLVYRAAELMRQHCRRPRGVRIDLCKRIPIGGGLAGGSSDAAAALIGLNRLWQLGLSRSELMAIGLKLGMDVPFCIMGGTALGKGKGEDLRALADLPPIDIVVGHPGLSSSTAEAYAGLRPWQMTGGAHTEAMVNAVRRGDVPAIAEGLYNVFEENLMARMPAIGRLKALMIEGGALNASLSGSGSCVFAIAPSPAAAEAIAASVRREFANVYVTKTRVSERQSVSSAEASA